MNSEPVIRTVRTELVEVQSIDISDGATCIANNKVSCSVRKYAALPFDRLRANGSPSVSGIEKIPGFLIQALGSIS